MRLINIWSLQLEEFFESDIPPYFILSHRWTDDEMTYKDYVKHRRYDSLGYRKVVDACTFARELNSFNSRKCPREWDAPQARVLQPGHAGDLDAVPIYIWIDTVCIDKRSSAELSEAINSMWAWYRDAEKCIAYLADVPAKEALMSEATDAFQSSSWFTRGWTLQELLAPTTVIFCDAVWQVLGHTCMYDHPSGCGCEISHGPRLTKLISEITRIPTVQLGQFEPGRSSIAQRMSWASRRVTTRIEDQAYCLLGLFDVNMPLIYGEGRKAFMRMQEEIMKRSNDQSIFAWRTPFIHPAAELGMLAPSAQWFIDSGNVHFREEDAFVSTRPYSITNNGVGLKVHLGEVRSSPNDNLGTRKAYTLELNCRLGTMDHELLWGCQEEESYRNLAFVKVVLSEKFARSHADDDEHFHFVRIMANSWGEHAEGSSVMSEKRMRIYVPVKTSLSNYWDKVLEMRERRTQLC